MYEIIKNVINSRRYSLEDMLTKIDTMWLQNNITTEQKEELITLAQQNADPTQSNAPLQEQIEELSKMIQLNMENIKNLQADIEAVKTTIEQGGTQVPTPQPEPQEEYPQWEPYSGIPPVKYNKGSKVTHNGKKWESQVDSNVWEPGAFGVGEEIWKEVMSTIYVL